MKQTTRLAFVALACLLACGCSTINVTVQPQPVGSGPLTVNIEQRKTLTGSLPVGDSAIEKGVRAATGATPQNAAGALGALKEIKP